MLFWKHLPLSCLFHSLQASILLKSSILSWRTENVWDKLNLKHPDVSLKRRLRPAQSCVLFHSSYPLVHVSFLRLLTLLFIMALVYIPFTGGLLLSDVISFLLVLVKSSVVDYLMSSVPSEGNFYRIHVPFGLRGKLSLQQFFSWWCLCRFFLSCEF